jgi:DNA-binding response OmpR family regulator
MIEVFKSLIMKKIIIVDDDPSIQDIFKLVLKPELYELTIMEDGKNLLNNEYEVPDLFILDKQLSGMDGIDLCRLLKSRNESNEIPVIMLSATPSIERLAKEAGADGSIAKPFRMKDLRDMVESFIKH